MGEHREKGQFPVLLDQTRVHTQTNDDVDSCGLPDRADWCNQFAQFVDHIHHNARSTVLQLSERQGYTPLLRS